MKIGVIIPIKKFTNSKQRLSSILTIDQRRKLSQCMLLDICDILISSKCFAQILIVSSEDEIHKYKNDIDITFLKEKYDKGVNHAVESGNKYFIDRNFEILILNKVPHEGDYHVKDGNTTIQLCAFKNVINVYHFKGLTIFLLNCLK